MKQDISYWMYSSVHCWIIKFKFMRLHACMCIYTLLVHMHTCVYIYMYCTMAIHILSTSGCHFLNVLKTMNVCVQNTVFLRRISDRFFLLLLCIRWVHFKYLDGKKPENPSEYPARPSLNVQDFQNPPSFSPLLPTTYPLWGKQDVNKNSGLSFFNLYLLFIGINLKSETFRGKISLG